MSTMSTLPMRHTYTASDLATMPDDGNRYELIDGTLIVTPAPAMRHQRAATRLVVVLAAACPPGLEVFAAPFDVRLATDTVVQPDVLVVRQDDLDDAGLPAVPLLAVEILSPSTRLVDLNLKKARYEKARCPAYWIVDPDEPSLTVWQLEDDGRYSATAHVTGDETLAVTTPFEVSLVPASLVSR